MHSNSNLNAASHALSKHAREKRASPCAPGLLVPASPALSPFPTLTNGHGMADASSTWDLSILDSWRGLMKGLNTGLIDLNTFKPEEYEYYDHPKNGDMHVMVPGKFVAFKGVRACVCLRVPAILGA